MWVHGCVTVSCHLSIHVRASNVATGLCACKTLHTVSDYNGVKRNLIASRSSEKASETVVGPHSSAMLNAP